MCYEWYMFWWDLLEIEPILNWVFEAGLDDIVSKWLKLKSIAYNNAQFEQSELWKDLQ
jgi:hypothetical protein